MTVRTLTELAALFPDNTSQAIKAADLRDLIDSVVTKLLTGGFVFIDTMSAGIANPASTEAFTVKSNDVNVNPIQVAADNGDGSGMRELFSIENNNPGPMDVNFRNTTIKIGSTGSEQKFGIGPLQFVSKTGQTGDYFQMFQPGSTSVIVARMDQGGTLILNVGGIASNAIVVEVFGDANAKWTVKEDGELLWGAGGASAQDISLKRTAANTLTLAAGDSLRTTGAVHASLPAASGFAAGSMYYCITDKIPLWSDGTSWYNAAGVVH